MPRCVVLVLLSLVLAANLSGQNAGRVTNAELGFSMEPPKRSAALDSPGSILGFAGEEKRYGSGAKILLSSIKRLSSPMDGVEAFMQRPTTVRMFHNTLVEGMVKSFPDLVSVDREFKKIGDRPAITGAFTFASGGIPMRGRYLIVLIKEQKALYTFTWSSDEKHFRDWNSAAEEAVRTFTFTPLAVPLSSQDA